MLYLGGSRSNFFLGFIIVFSLFTKLYRAFFYFLDTVLGLTYDTNSHDSSGITLASILLISFLSEFTGVKPNLVVLLSIILD